MKETILEPREDCDFKERESFIKDCVNSGMTFLQIGKAIGLSKQRVYQIYRYGYKNLNYKIRDLKERVKIRDNNLCRLCKKTGQEEKLGIHHLDSPKDNSLSNLITLCNSCHMKFEAYTKKLKVEYLKTKIQNK